MMLRTHLALAGLIILLFLPRISNKFIFIFIALVATLIPDLDTGYSALGKNKSFRPIQLFTRHRGVFHSFTFCIIASIILAGILPVVALAFFIGYASHLFADSFTIDGIQPFWPYKKKSFWRFKTGSLTETGLFIFLVIADVLAFFFVILKV